MSIHQWTMSEAKAKFGELVKTAQKNGPQTITRRGRKVAVITAAAQKSQTPRKGNLAEFLLASPLRGSGIKIERLGTRLR